MSSYKNNKDGTLSSIATNNHITQITQPEQYVTEAELVEGLSSKQDIIQYATLPTASSEELGNIYQYVGATTVDYTHGYIYECVTDGTDYSWERIDVQPSGGSGGTSDYIDLTNKPQVEGVTLVGNKTASDLGLATAASLATKQDKLQFTTMPTASAVYLDKIVQFVGTTTANYTYGYFYKCVNNGGVYGWERVDVQPSSGGEVYTAGKDIDITNNVISVANRYTIMPSKATLLTMADGTVFETDGYWIQTDGHGGKYLIKDTRADGMLPITDGTTTKYLAVLDNDGNRIIDYVDPTRFGVRGITRLNMTLTPSGTYATQNSTIMSDIIANFGSYYNSTIRFPRGYYVFESPINVTGRQLSIVGEGQPICRAVSLTNNAYDIGTTLCFPFLTNGQIAVQLQHGNIENVAVYGNKDTYNIVFNRNAIPEHPEQAVTETVAESDGTPIKCTAINQGGVGWVKNVFVFNFYTGLTCSGSTYVQDFYAKSCHYGIKCGNDTKIEGIFGYDTHTLVSLTGSLCSVLHERADSCVHALEILNGFSHTVTDVDGDWCADSLIAIGDGVTYGDVGSVVFTGIHGRCNTLKVYDTTTHPDPIDVRDLGANTDGYGIIRVYPRVNFTDSVMTINNHGGAKPTNGASTLLTPDILFTFASTDITNLEKLTFVLAKGIYNKDDILRIIQTRDGFTAKVEDASGTYFINGNGISEYIKGDWITPQQFGAVADGVTDDTTAIQSAFNAIHTAGGGTVYFPKGTYIISSTVYVYSNTTVFADKGQAILKAVDTPSSAYALLQMGNASSENYTANINISGLIMRGSEVYGSDQGGIILMYVVKSTNISVTNCLFQNNKYAAIILATGTNNVRVFSSRFEACDLGVASLGPIAVSDVTVRNCHFTGKSSLNSFTNAASEQVGTFTNLGSGISYRWVVEDCVFEYKTTNVVAFNVNYGQNPMPSDIYNKDCVVRNCTIRYCNKGFYSLCGENISVDGLFFDDTENPDSIFEFDPYGLVQISKSNHVTLRNITSDSKEMRWAIGISASSHVLVEGVDCYVPKFIDNDNNGNGNGLTDTFFIVCANSSNVILKDFHLRPIDSNANTAVINLNTVTDSYFDVKGDKNNGSKVLYMATSTSDTLQNNTFVFDSDIVTRNFGQTPLISTADPNEYINLGEYTATAMKDINETKIVDKWIIKIDNQTHYNQSLATTNFVLLNNNAKFKMEFVSTTFSNGKTFSFNTTGNIIPINNSFTISNDYKVVCYFVQKNAKWVEVKRTLEYYEGATVDITNGDNNLAFIEALTNNITVINSNNLLNLTNGDYTGSGLTLNVKDNIITLNANNGDITENLYVKLTNGVAIAASSIPSSWKSETVDFMELNKTYGIRDFTFGGTTTRNGIVASCRDSTGTSILSRSKTNPQQLSTAIAFIILYIPKGAVLCDYKVGVSITENTIPKDWGTIVAYHDYWKKYISQTLVDTAGFISESTSGLYTQGMCSDGTYLYVSEIDNTDSHDTYIHKYSLADGSLVSSVNSYSLGHCNSMTYCPIDGKIYCVALDNVGTIHRINTDLTYGDSFTIDLSSYYSAYTGVGAISYNEKRNQFVCLIRGTQKGYAIFDTYFNLLDIVWTTSIRNKDGSAATYGSFYADDNFIYQVAYNANGVHVFTWQGEYIGNVILPDTLDITSTIAPEPEDIAIVGDYMYINYTDTLHSHVYVIKLGIRDLRYACVIKR